jgi:5-methylcytosine-specific restriction endonuclease McrA
MREEILKLREEGKSYREIEKELGCSKGTISYHCGKGQKEKNQQRSKEWKEDNKAKVKIYEFRDNRSYKYKRSVYDRLRNDTRDPLKRLSTVDVLHMLEENPICYLTGRPIDLEQTDTWQLDHIIPRALGGTSDIDNMGLTHTQANQSKNALTVDDFITLCKEVLEHNGYSVRKDY